MRDSAASFCFASVRVGALIHGTAPSASVMAAAIATTRSEAA